MTFIYAIELLGFAVGIVLQLSLFVLIRRYRRIGKLEILFLSLITCLLLWNTCRFLFVVFKVTASITPLNAILLQLGVALPSFCVLALLPSLSLHTHIVFQRQFTHQHRGTFHSLWEIAVYLPLVAFPLALADFKNYAAEHSILTATAYAKPFAGWFALALAISAVIDWRMMLQTQSPPLRNLFRTLIIIFLSIAGLIVFTYFVLDFQAELNEGDILEAVLMLWSTVPCALLGYYIFQYNFLEIAIQRSFGYTFVGVLLLLVYLLCVNWLKDVIQREYSLPGLVIQDALIFALLGFAQPIKHWIDRSVNALFSLEISRFEAIASRLDDVSHSTVEMEKLLRYIEDLLTRELDLKVVTIVLSSPPAQEPPSIGPELSSGEAFEPFLLSTGKEELGEIRVASRSGKLSTEQQAALRFLTTKIVAAIENCRLTEGKIRLEHELAEQDKMATIGRMARTVAHNIRNPLSAIKTIVQLMREDADVGPKHDRDLALISGEIDRLDRSVTDLLKFPGPTASTSVKVDLAEILEKMICIFKAETDRRRIKLDLELSSRPLMVGGSEDVFSEVLQNLLVNALDAVPDGSRIEIRGQVLPRHQATQVVVWIDDEGPGIPPAIRQQIFKPFFTTKQKGTGLGLAIVLKRIVDLGGEIDCISPIANGRGTRFEIILPFHNTDATQEVPR
jgi:signal transduction histidine kinase